MKHPVRLSPDGDVAVRDLVDDIHGSGLYTWRSTQGKWLTDADTDGWIDLQPGPSAMVEIRKNGAFFDVDVNGKPGARRVASMVAGEFAAQVALQKGEPVMLIAAEASPSAAPEPARALSLVRDNQDGG